MNQTKTRPFFLTQATALTPAPITAVITAPLTGKTVQAGMLVLIAVRLRHINFAASIRQVNKRHIVPPLYTERHKFEAPGGGAGKESSEEQAPQRATRHGVMDWSYVAIWR